MFIVIVIKFIRTAVTVTKHKMIYNNMMPVAASGGKPVTEIGQMHEGKRYQDVGDGWNQAGQRSLRSLKDFGTVPDRTPQNPPHHQPKTP